jgi:alkylation response protein AidB-like acyl-CoA dehydrogenase
MDFDLSDEEKALRETVRQFVTKELLPLEADVLRREREHQRGLERDTELELRNKAKGFGFWGLSTPQEYGGMDLSAVLQSLIWTELGRTYVPFRFGGEADNILYFCDDEQRAAYLLPTIAGERVSCFAMTEPGAGSDAANISMRADRDGDDWVLNGEKTFITNGDDADFAIVIAVTDREAGAGNHGATAFLVDRDMGWTSSHIQTMGEGGPAALHFADVRVPSRNILGEMGQGFELAMRWIWRGRYIIPSFAIGIAERALGMAVEYANTRQTFGKAIGTNQAIAWKLADCETELEAARWLTLRAAWTIDRGLDPRHSSAMSKLYGANMVNKVVDDVMQIFGGVGYTRELPVEHWYRVVRLYRIFEGTDEMQRMVISRDLLRGYTKIGGHLG